MRHRVCGLVHTHYLGDMSSDQEYSIIESLHRTPMSILDMVLVSIVVTVAQKDACS